MGLIHHKNLSFNHRKELILLSPECKKFFLPLLCWVEPINCPYCLFQALEEKKIPINRIRLLTIFYFISYVNMKAIFAVMNTT